MSDDDKKAKSLNELLAETSAKATANRKAAEAAGTSDEEMTPSDLWNALTAIPRPTKKVPFPRVIPGTQQPIGHVLMWPLTQDEQHAANASADKFAKELMKDPQKAGDANLGYNHAYTNDLAIQIIYRACRDENDVERAAFPSPKLLRQHLSTDEAGVLFAAYCTVQSELGPIRARMSREEYEALVIRLAEGASAVPLDAISWEQQRSLAVFTASQLVRCWTAMSSAGLPHGASTFAIEMLAEIAKAKEAAAARGEEPELPPDLVAPEPIDEPDAPPPPASEKDE